MSSNSAVGRAKKLAKLDVDDDDFGDTLTTIGEEIDREERKKRRKKKILEEEERSKKDKESLEHLVNTPLDQLVRENLEGEIHEKQKALEKAKENKNLIEAKKLQEELEKLRTTTNNIIDANEERKKKKKEKDERGKIRREKRRKEELLGRLTKLKEDGYKPDDGINKKSTLEAIELEVKKLQKLKKEKEEEENKLPENVTLMGRYTGDNWRKKNTPSSTPTTTTSTSTTETQTPESKCHGYYCYGRGGRKKKYKRRKTKKMRKKRKTKRRRKTTKRRKKRRRTKRRRKTKRRR